MARTDNLDNFLTDIANAIRNKNGTTAGIPAVDFDTEINNISTGVNIVVVSGNVNASPPSVTFEKPVIAIFYRGGVYRTTSTIVYSPNYYVNKNINAIPNFVDKFDNSYPQSMPTASGYNNGSYEHYVTKISSDNKTVTWGTNVTSKHLSVYYVALLLDE